MNSKINRNGVRLFCAFTLLLSAVLGSSRVFAGGGRFYIPAPAPSPAEVAKRQEQIRKEIAERNAKSRAQAIENCLKNMPNEFMCIHGDVIRPTHTAGSEIRSNFYVGPKVGVSALYFEVAKKNCSFNGDQFTQTADLRVTEYFKAATGRDAAMTENDMVPRNIRSDAFVTGAVYDPSHYGRANFIVRGWSPLFDLTNLPRSAPLYAEVNFRRNSILDLSGAWNISPSQLVVRQPARSVAVGHLLPIANYPDWFAANPKGTPLIPESSARYATYRTCFIVR